MYDENINPFFQGHHHMPETRGLCLSEEQTVSTVRILLSSSFNLNIFKLYSNFFEYKNISFALDFQIFRMPGMGTGNPVIDMRTEPYRLTRRCEVTAILILYGLPR